MLIEPCFCIKKLEDLSHGALRAICPIVCQIALPSSPTQTGFVKESLGTATFCQFLLSKNAQIFSKPCQRYYCICFWHGLGIKVGVICSRSQSVKHIITVPLVSRGNPRNRGWRSWPLWSSQWEHAACNGRALVPMPAVAEGYAHGLGMAGGVSSAPNAQLFLVGTIYSARWARCTILVNISCKDTCSNEALCSLGNQLHVDTPSSHNVASESAVGSPDCSSAALGRSNGHGRAMQA